MGVYSISNEEKGHLIDGDYFCELSLVTDKEIRMSSVVALTPCKVRYSTKPNSDQDNILIFNNYIQTKNDFV